MSFVDENKIKLLNMICYLAETKQGANAKTYTGKG